jgi:CheY-like chemotaxis protein
MVLIVDDNNDVRSILAILLISEGYGVAEAVDGQAALERALHGDVSLIVLDIAMPRLDGAAFCRAYHARGGHAPIILITAAHEQAVNAAMTACGPVDYIQKPFEIDQALQIIKRHAGRPA